MKHQFSLKSGGQFKATPAPLPFTLYPAIMHATSTLDDLRIKGEPPNIRLHKLRGDRREYWSVTIKLPWCITFKFSDGEFSAVSIENYHRG